MNRFIRRTLGIAVVVFNFSTTVMAGTYAWWITEMYEPTELTVESIPIKQLDTSWRSALVLTREVLSKEAREYVDRLPSKVNLFAVNGDFNADGIADKALVGVYREDSGKTGRFLLILSQTATGSWKKTYLSKLEGEPGFSTVGGGHKTGLHWEFCFECDSGALVIKWNGVRYEERR